MMFQYYNGRDAELSGTNRGVSPANKSSKKKRTTQQNLTSSNKTNPAVPAGAKVKYVATFITKEWTVFDVVDPARTTRRRNRLSNKKQRVKEAFEQAFNDVNVVLSAGAGAYEVNFTVRQNWDDLIALRQYSGAIMEAATEERVQTSYLAVTSKGQNVKNSPSDRNEQIRQTRNQVVQDVYSTTKDVAVTTANNLTGGIGGLLTNSGYLLPIAILSGVIFIVVMTKK
jgi:sensor c-di-GMP phosphodiesterase-like protein